MPKRYSVGERAVRLPRDGSETRGAAYLDHPRDAVRDTFETAFFARELDRLLKETGARRVADLGCGDGLLGRLAGERLDEYLGVDLNTPARDLPRGRFLRHDLREGLGAVGKRPFDLYVGSFGIASHLTPAALERLLKEIAAHARIGSVMAIEALGLYSLEWPCIWGAPPGSARTLEYRLADETKVHPWSPPELAAVMESAGITPLRALDRSVQAGPKLGTGDYWHGLPAVRPALNRLLVGDGALLSALDSPLPALPAHPAASLHRTLHARRREWLAKRGEGEWPASIARGVWELEPDSRGGFGHGLLVTGRVRRAQRERRRSSHACRWTPNFLSAREKLGA